MYRKPTTMNFWFRSFLSTRTTLVLCIFLIVSTSSGVCALDEGFDDEQIIQGKGFMTDFRFTPDGQHMFVALKDGQVYVYWSENPESFDFNNEKQALDIEDIICHNGEQGIEGLALHPKFGTENRWVYLYYTFQINGNCDENSSQGPVNRFARYDVTDDWTINRDSEVVFFDTDVVEKKMHNAGSVQFGKDGYIYITTGDGGTRQSAGLTSNLLGGIIRLTENNEIPPSNPSMGLPGAERCSRGSDTKEYGTVSIINDDDGLTTDASEWPSIEIVGNDGSPSEAFPLSLCQGDCDGDGDCADGLVCAQRDTGDTVAGCAPPGEDATDRDVCVPAGQQTSSSGEKKCLELYAVGLRNPFKMAMNPNVAHTEFMVNDVGAELWEEMTLGGDMFINKNNAKGLHDFGWPSREGPCKPNSRSDCQDPSGGGDFRPPYHFYIHQDGGAAVGGSFIPDGIWPSNYDGGYLYGEFVFGKIYLVKDTGDEDCYDCNPPVSRKEVTTFVDFEDIISVGFGPYLDCKQAFYYTSSAQGGVMRRVFYTGSDAPQPSCNDDQFIGSDQVTLETSPTEPPATEPSPTEPPETQSPTATPTVFPLVGEGEGGYPGELLPWSSDCEDGIAFCGVIEFCNDKETDTFAYRLPCQEEVCECVGISGPLIRLEPGNKYKLVLRNMAEESHSTNLHTHGLHIVGSGNGDDVVRQVSGGGNCLDYVWDIASDHPGGTYWYHAHHHGHSQEQVEGGAFGLLIVEDNLELNPDTPEWASNERILQIYYSDKEYKIWGNRKTNEAIDIDASQWYRLRVSTVDSDALPRNLTFHDDRAYCMIHRVANDGIWRSSVPGPSSNVFEMTGASRADYAILCFNQANVGAYHVPITYGDLQAATIRVAPHQLDKPLGPSMSGWEPVRPYALQDLRELPVPADNYFSIKLGYDYVNSVKWDPLVPLKTIAFDSVHEWVIHQTAQHPFHLHLYHMQIVEPGGCGIHEEGEWYDTVSTPGNCTVRFLTADIGQRCVLHCHVLFHEDNGSMSWVDVQPAIGADMPVNTVQSFEYQCLANTLAVPSKLVSTSKTNNDTETSISTANNGSMAPATIPTAMPKPTSAIRVVYDANATSKRSGISGRAADSAGPEVTIIESAPTSAAFQSISYAVIGCLGFFVMG